MLSFQEAIEQNNYLIVKYWVNNQQIDPSVDSNLAIITAAKNGFDSIVSFLMGHERVNPADLTNEALFCAAENGHLSVVLLLLSSKRVRVVPIV